MSSTVLSAPSDENHNVGAENFVEINILTSSDESKATDNPSANPEKSPWNFTVIMTGITVCMSAFFCGYDGGMGNLTMIFATENPDLGITPLWQGAIVSAVSGLAGFGALIAAPLSDKLGRKRVINMSTAIYTIGNLIAVIAINRYMLLLARIIDGLFIGIACLLVPIYLSECSPVSVRGTMVSMFQLSSNIGGIAANLISASVTGLDTANISWRLLFLFPCFVTVIQMVAFTFLPESPNWVYGHMGRDETVKILKNIYSDDEEAVAAALDGIIVEQKQVNESQGYTKIFTTDYVYRALILGVIIQLLNAFSGNVTIMSFIGTTIKSIGITDQLSIIWFSCLVSIVSTVFSFVPLFTIDRFGRRPLLLFSQIASGLTLLVITASFYQVANTTGAVVPQASTDLFVVNCQRYTSCSSCIQDTQCNFCGPSDRYSASAGYCLPPSGNATCEGPLVDVHWEFFDAFCPTAWSWVPLVCILTFLAVFSSGFASVPWTLNAEFYPLWARGNCAALAAATVFWGNLIIALTFLSVVEAITVYATYLIFAVITLLGALFCFYALPETMNRSIEEIQQMFMPKNSKNKVRPSEGMKLTEINPKRRSVKDEDEYL